MMRTGMQARTAMLIGLAGLAGGWLAGSMSAPAASQAPTTSQRRGPRALGSAEPAAPFTEQLRLKLQEQPPSPAPGRSPFSFGSRRAAPAAHAHSAEVEAPPTPAPTPVVETPRARFELSGIAGSTVDGASIFTAILTDNGAMVLAKAGETLAGGVSVSRVDETSVVLVDPRGHAQTLRLK